MKIQGIIEVIYDLAMTIDNRTVVNYQQKHQARIVTGAVLDTDLLRLENNKVNNNQAPLRTSRKYKIASIKNANILNGNDFNGISIKPTMQTEQPIFELNASSKGSIRQSYDNSHKNISLGNLNTIESKKSMRSQHRRRRKSREENHKLPERKKRKDSRLFKKSFGGPAIKINLNQNNLTLNQNALKNYKLPICDKPMSNKAKLINESLITQMQYKGNEITGMNYNTHNTIETVRGPRKDKNQLMLNTRVNGDNSQMMNSARNGKQIRLKTNLKRVSNNNRYKPINITDEDEVKAQSLSRSKPKRQVPNINTSLVVTKNHLKKNLITGKVDGEDRRDSERIQSNDKKRLITSIDVKSKNQTASTHRQKQKVISNQESQPEVQTAANMLNESQSEAKPSKPKQSALRTLENSNNSNKLTTKPISNINKTISQIKSGRSPTGSSFTNPQAPKTVQSEKPEFPMGAGRALKLFMPKLSDYEKGEILDFRQVYFLGLECK